MKITAKQLRHIIKEEISRVSEATPRRGGGAPPPARGGGSSSPAIAKMLQALNLQQVVSDIDNEFAPNFEVDNTDKKVFKAGDVVVDAEYDGGRFVVRVTDAGLEIMSKPAGGRARKAVLKDASPASAEKLADFANSAFGSAGGLEIFDVVNGVDMLRSFTDEYELRLTIDNTAKNTMKSGEVIARMEYEPTEIPAGFKGKKPFLELVHRLDGLEVRTSNPEMNTKYPSASWGVEDDLHNHIAAFWRV